MRRGAHEVRDVQNIADILVDPEGALERRNHWEKTSHALLVGAILHVLYAGEDKTLRGVANFLNFGLVSVSASELDPQLLARVVYAQPLALACAPQHPLAGKKWVTWGAISDLEHITLRSVYSTRRTVDRILKAQGLELRSTIQVGTLATALGLVKGGAGVTLIPGYAREYAFDLGLKVLDIEEETPYLHELSLLTRRGLKPSIAAGAFIEHMDTLLRRFSGAPGV